MTPENFAFWLKGYLEISDAKTLNEKQTQIIKDHLNLVFNKVTPTYNTVIEENNTQVEIEKQEIDKKISKRKKISFQDILDNCNPTEIKILPRFKPTVNPPRRNNRGNDSNKLLC